MFKIRVPVDDRLNIQLAAAWVSLEKTTPLNFAWWETNPLYIFYLEGNHLREFTLDLAHSRFYRRYGNRWNYEARRPGSEPPVSIAW